MRKIIITHSHLAWSAARVQAAAERSHGLQALSIEHLAARLAGGFLQPINSDALKAAIAEAKAADLGELWLSGYDCETVKVAELAIGGPMIAVGRPADPPPWDVLSYAPLVAVAEAYARAGADVCNLPVCGAREAAA